MLVLGLALLRSEAPGFYSRLSSRWLIHLILPFCLWTSHVSGFPYIKNLIWFSPANLVSCQFNSQTREENLKSRGKFFHPNSFLIKAKKNQETARLRWVTCASLSCERKGKFAHMRHLNISHILVCEISVPLNVQVRNSLSPQMLGCKTQCFSSFLAKCGNFQASLQEPRPSCWKWLATSSRLLSLESSSSFQQITSYHFIRKINSWNPYLRETA